MYMHIQYEQIYIQTGSGKTTLLNVLSSRIRVSSAIVRLEGNIYYNGHIFDQAAVKKYSAYVTQDDTLFSYLTVRETILLAAKFHLPCTVKNKTIEEIADGIIRELSLLSFYFLTS
jgi:ABC-type multidrug transport system ATPase subunit